jgi:hypothetical protein
MKAFFFKHAGKATALAWFRYKAKECWFLARSVCHVAETGTTSLILHNSVASKLRITKDFVETRTAGLGLADAQFATIAAPCSRPTALQAALAVALLLLPVRVMKAWVQAILARRPALPGTVVVFCDAHLAGFVLVEALRALGVNTATLQHGLYRTDDIGSRMAFENFVADRILLWDAFTKQAFLDFGLPETRLQVCGQYGFSHLLKRRETAQAENSVAICPPYDKARVPFFLNLAKATPPGGEIRYSLHPILRRAYPDLQPEPLTAMTPRPSVSVCGDGGVIMDSLACGIPVISVGPRRLAGAHLFADAPVPTAQEWDALVEIARASFKKDLRLFGFSAS